MNYTRHEQRKFAMQILYTYEQGSISLEEAVRQVFDNFEKSDEAVALVNNVMENKDKIDSLIESKLKNYHMSRLNAVDRAILRLSVGEMLNATPKGVAINEALELTREFSDSGDNKAVHFNNAVLDAVSKEI